MRANFDQCILKVEQNFELKNLAGKLGSKTLLAPKINCKLKFESFTANYRKGGGEREWSFRDEFTGPNNVSFLFILNNIN